MKTPRFFPETSQNFIGDSKVFVGDPQIFLGHNLEFYWRPQQKSWGLQDSTPIRGGLQDSTPIQMFFSETFMEIKNHFFTLVYFVLTVKLKK